MFSQFSVGGRPKSSQRPRVGLTMKVMKDQPQLCFSCQQMFPSRERLEEHCCPAAAFICSCGAEFPVYTDMLEHSQTHEPGASCGVQDPKSVVRRRSVQMRQHEEQLRKLARPAQPQQGTWTLPLGPGGSQPGPARMASGQYMMAGKMNATSAGAGVNARLPLFASKVLPAGMLPSASMQQGPGGLQNPLSALAAGPAAPTADLWTLYQPVVVVRKEEVRFNKELRFICGKCEMRFRTRRELTTHLVNTHITDKVFGCIGCGVLLSSKKSVPRYHQCNSHSSSLKMRLITARPFNDRKKAPNRMNSARANNNSRIDLTRAHDSVSSYRKAQHPRPAVAAPNPNPRPLQTSARMQTEFMLANLVNKPAEMAAGVGNKKNSFTCQICHIEFEALQMLQRHKCAKAREFVEQQLQLGKLPNRFRKLTQPSPASSLPAGKNASSYPALHLNGNSKRAFTASGNNVKATFTPAPKSPRLAARMEVSARKAIEASKADIDDDECFIVESSPAPVAKPVATPVGKPVATPVGKPVATPVGKPVATPVGKPVATPVAIVKSSPTPVLKPVATPVAEPVPTPVAEPVPTPVAEPVPTPVAEPVATPVPTPVATPVAEPVPTPVAEPVPTPVAEPVPTHVAEPVPTPVAEHVPTPVAEPVPTPVAEPVPTPVAEPVPTPVAMFQALNSEGNTVATPVQLFQALNSSFKIIQM